MPVAGGAHHVGGSTALVARATKRVVQFRFHQFLDKPAHPIPDDHLDRVKPSRAKQRRGLHRRVSAILLHGVISISGVSPPSLSLHKPEITPPQISTTSATAPFSCRRSRQTDVTLSSTF